MSHCEFCGLSARHLLACPHAERPRGYLVHHDPGEICSDCGAEWLTVWEDGQEAEGYCRNRCHPRTRPLPGRGSFDEV